MNYRPETREVPARCYATQLWIAGAICVPLRRGLQDHLNQNEPFLKLRNAAFPGKEAPLPFLALRREAISLILPTPRERESDRIDREQAPGKYTGHRVTCRLQAGAIAGRLEILAMLRLSDFLMRSPGFFVLRECILCIPTPEDPTPSPQATPLALVNTNHVLGVTEEELDGLEVATGEP